MIFSSDDIEFLKFISIFFLPFGIWKFFEIIFWIIGHLRITII